LSSSCSLARKLAPILKHRTDYLVSWFYTGGRSPWTGGKLVAKPLPKQRTTLKQKKRGHILNIHAQGGIRNRNSGLRPIEDASCLRPLGYRDWLNDVIVLNKSHTYHYASWTNSCLAKFINLNIFKIVFILYIFYK
jgi:hypothetical protein